MDNKIKNDIIISPAALEQLALILEHDFSLEDQVFRLQIDGKGCGGFDYAIGFTEAFADDVKIKLEIDHPRGFLHLDPFSAFYCAQGNLDYINDPANNLEGFSFTNSNEKKYRGKFFKDESKLPPQN